MENNSKRKKLVEVLICLVVWIACICLGNVRYESNDDTILNMIAAGAYGEPSQFILYINIVYGYFLKLLYTVVPAVNWYLWMFLILNFLGVTCISFAFTDELKLPGAILVTVMINALLYDDFYLSVQYTKNATFYGIIGIILLIWLMRNESRNVAWRIISALFIFAGFCIRPLAFVMMLPFALLPLLFLFIRQRSRKSAVITYFVLPALLLIIGFAANYKAYTMKPEWKYFFDWDSIMVEKCDHGNYNFEWDKEEYLASGFTKTDFMLMEFWYWADTEYFTLDKLKLMKEIGSDTRVDTLRVDPIVFEHTNDRIIKTMRERPHFYVLTALLALAVPLLKTKALVLFACELLLVYAEYYFFICTKRIEWRVECGILISAILITSFVVFARDNIKSSMLERIKRISNIRSTSGIMIVSAFLITALITGQLFYQFTAIKKGRLVLEPDIHYEQLQELSKREGFYIANIDVMFGDCAARKISLT